LGRVEEMRDRWWILRTVVDISVRVHIELCVTQKRQKVSDGHW
jgi:hypothetical protein